MHSSDSVLLDWLRQRDSMTVSELATAMQVTATAVRQRLTRLQAEGLIERTAAHQGRGRPTHHYRLTDKGRRQAGANFADLAVALWEELRSIQDPEVRRGLMQRLGRRLAEMASSQIAGSTLEEKMRSLSEWFRERQIPFSVDQSKELPVLNASACPYPGLAEQDHAICAVEQMMFSELLGEKVQLTQCRLDGSSCCTFESKTS